MGVYELNSRIIRPDQPPWGFAPPALPTLFFAVKGIMVYSATTLAAMQISTSDVHSATTLEAMQISKGDVLSATTAS